MKTTYRNRTDRNKRRSRVVMTIAIMAVAGWILFVGSMVRAEMRTPDPAPTPTTTAPATPTESTPLNPPNVNAPNPPNGGESRFCRKRLWC